MKPEGWDVLGESWRTDNAGVGAIDATEIRKRADAFARKIRSRNLREYVAAVIVIVGALRMTFSGQSKLFVAAGILMAAATVFVSVVIYRRGGNAEPPSVDAPTKDVLAHEYSELAKQAELLAKAWLWYVMPLVPSLVLIYIDAYLRERSLKPVLLFAGTCVVLVGIAWINRHAAKKLRQKMTRLSGPE